MRMKIINKFGIPEVFVDAVTNDPYSSEKSDITISQLISPPRIVALKKKYSDVLEFEVTDMLFSLYGQAIHHILERAEREAVTEERLYIQRQGWVIGGKFDRLLLEKGILQDYKVTSVYSIKNGHRKEWEAQLNILAHILRENGNNINKLEVVVMLRDWSKSKSERSKDYPQTQVQVIEVFLWSEERCELYIDERVRLHQLAERELPMCSSQEKWQKKSQWKLKKIGGKRAKKIYENQEEAELALKESGENYTLDFIDGKCIRCDSYCPVLKFCSSN